MSQNDIRLDWQSTRGHNGHSATLTHLMYCFHVSINLAFQRRKTANFRWICVPSSTYI